MWQTKYASAVPKSLGVGLNFWPCSEGYFLPGRLQSVSAPITKHNYMVMIQFCYSLYLFGLLSKNHLLPTTVGINPILSDLNTPQTLGWRYFEAKIIIMNEVQIRKNSQKGTGTKMAEKLNNFEKFERKRKSNFSPILNPETS